MRRVFTALAVWALVAGFWGCGGGGGGSSGPSMAYTGLTSPAVLDSSNVEELALFAAGGGATVPDVASWFLGGTERVTSRAKSAARAAGQSASTTEYGSCGGKADISATLNEDTGNFTFVIEASGYCEEGETMDGTVTFSGKMDGEGEILRAKITFGVVTMKSEGEDFTLSGTISETLIGENPYVSMTLNMRDNIEGTSIRLEDYTVTKGYVDGGHTETISGRVYQSDLGYVDIATEEPFVYPLNSENPSSGSLVISGANGAKARFTATSNAAYAVTADLDGDGGFDDFSTGAIHYPGLNNQPSVSAGTNKIDNVGCGAVAITDASASDLDADSLSISWSFTSKPGSSTAQIDGADTLSPSFTPDAIGDYVLKLTVSDGIGAPVESEVTATVYGDLFCLDEKIFISAALCSTPTAVAIGDVTGDGLSDVVMTTSFTNTFYLDSSQDFRIFVFAQNQQGDLESPVSYPAGDGESLAIADLNGDSRNDVAVSSQTGVGVFYQSAGGTLLPMETLPPGESIGYYEANEVVTADFTDDGLADLVSVYGSANGQAIIRLWVQGQAGLSAPLPLSTDLGRWRARAADANGDGKTDLLLTTGNLGIGQGGVLFGTFARVLPQSGGTLTSSIAYLDETDSTPGGYSSDSMGFSDFDGDLRPDLAAAKTLFASEYAVRVYPQQENGLPGPPLFVSAARYYEQLEAAKLTGDSKDDLIGVCRRDNLVFDVFRQGQSGLEGAESYPISLASYNPSYYFSGAHTFAVGDVDGDGHSDVVSVVNGSSGGNGLLVLKGNPNRQ